MVIKDYLFARSKCWLHFPTQPKSWLHFLAQPKCWLHFLARSKCWLHFLTRSKWWLNFFAQSKSWLHFLTWPKCWLNLFARPKCWLDFLLGQILVSHLVPWQIFKETCHFMTNFYWVKIIMIMLRSTISWMIHNPPTLSPQYVVIKSCHKSSTIF